MRSSRRLAFFFILRLRQIALGCMMFAGSLQAQDSRINKDSLAAVFDRELRGGILAHWYPKMIDTVYGGYFSNASAEWELTSRQPKMLVTQSRGVWTCSEAAMFCKDSAYKTYAQHGVKFLLDRMWDSDYGGFFNSRSREGTFARELYADRKTAYGNAFAIYALCSYYRLTGDSRALDFAKRTFSWLEAHSHDDANGGYVDLMDRQGNWLPAGKGGQDFWKDYNSSIHILEAYTELYKIWHDPLVKQRLQEMMAIVCDTFVNEKGYLNLNFTANWQLITNRDSDEKTFIRLRERDHVSFGHDVETAFLLLEASFALGTDYNKTLEVAKKLVDHSLKNGFDWKCGGFYNEGYYFKGRDTIAILDKNAQWWTQAEGLNALLLMAELFPLEKQYSDAFLLEWSYIDQWILDKRNGEWFFNGSNYNPSVVNAPKATVWKCNYHNSRALMNCIRMLRNENEMVKHFTGIIHQ
ncbi:MAG: AGE family epimerase/isomerase [Bacteroidales bacterium]